MSGTRMRSLLLILPLLGCKSSFDAGDGSESSDSSSSSTNADGDEGSDASADASESGSTGDGDDSGDGDGEGTGDGDESSGDGDGDGDGEGDFCNGANSITFNDPFERTVGVSATMMEVGDFVGDGPVDIVLAAGSGSGFVVMRNNGGGGNFPESQIESIDLGTDGVESISLGRLDAGDKLDLLAVLDAGIWLYYGTGDNNLGSAIELEQISVGNVNYGAGTIVDLGGMSSRGEVVVSRQVDGNHELMIFDGATVETAMAPDVSGIAIPEKAARMLVGEFDEDDELDLLSIHPDDSSDNGSFSVALNAPGGDLALDPIETLATIGSTDHATHADLDLDGNTDLVVVNTGTFGGSPEDITIYWGSDVGFSNADKTSITVGDLLGFAAINDFNCDGHRDIAVSVPGETRVAFLLGDSARGFTDGGELDLGSDGPFAMVSGDFDGDGAPDLAMSLPMVEKVRIYNHI